LSINSKNSEKVERQKSLKILDMNKQHKHSFQMAGQNLVESQVENISGQSFYRPRSKSMNIRVNKRYKASPEKNDSPKFTLGETSAPSQQSANPLSNPMSSEETRVPALPYVSVYN